MANIDPSQPEIYRRRRLAAVGLGVAGLVVLLVLAYLVFAGGDDSVAKGSGGSSSAKSTATTSVTSSAATSTATAPAGPCPDTSVAVKATVDHPTYQKGEQPVFGIVVTNISTQSCTRDFGSNQQQVLVYTLDGSKRLWSNLDCFPSPDPQVKALNPGKQEVSSVKWQETTSAPNCDGDRAQVPPGAYSVVAQLGNVRSTPEPFNIS